MFEIFSIVGIVILFSMAVGAFLMSMWSILQSIYKAGIKRGIEIERGEWNSVGDIPRPPIAWDKIGKGTTRGVR